MRRLGPIHQPRKQQHVATMLIRNNDDKERKRRRPVSIRTLFLLLSLLLGLLLFVSGKLYFQTNAAERATTSDPSKTLTVGPPDAAITVADSTLDTATKERTSKVNFDAVSSDATQSQTAHDEKKKKDPSRPYYHIIFSTSCSDKMHWESYVLFYHAFAVKQPGNVTRLLSGCSDEQAKQQQVFFQQHIKTLSPYFHLHLTPDFSQIDHHKEDNKKERYKYINKPLSLRHWLENVLGYDDHSNSNEQFDNDIIFLIDPDMILVQPLTHDFSDSKYDAVIWVEAQEELQAPGSKIVRHGHPFAQQDGSLASDWLELNLTAITLDPNTPAHAIVKDDGPIHWNSGPPYILTARDAYQVAQLWTEYTPRVHKQYPFTFAEMFGYIVATAHLQLSHTMIKSLVVTTTATPNREAWPLVDVLPDGSVCPFPNDEASASLNHGLFVLHYNKRYLLGNRTFWSKYRMPGNILDCALPLLDEPLPSIQSERQSLWPPPTIRNQLKMNWTSAQQDFAASVSAKTAKREAFMLCGLISKTNEALEYYKRRACPNGTGNVSKVYNTHTDPGY